MRKARQTEVNREHARGGAEGLAVEEGLNLGVAFAVVVGGRGEAKPQAAQSYSLRSPPSTSRLRTLAVSLGLA